MQSYNPSKRKTGVQVTERKRPALQPPPGCATCSAGVRGQRGGGVEPNRAMTVRGDPCTQRRRRNQELVSALSAAEDAAWRHLSCSCSESLSTTRDVISSGFAAVKGCPSGAH
ncbi:hypothetical protein AAFF_G00158730 [Aldrovandia affinis]|uniref:Uncharacterized protein n=1 Tax=Aldrovandia affinis TaxID=143900 RepID=A0AAD7RND1_9TELE|nr:hypothetical protein AAFF_G00158730 [Aldrovandia affinis]